MTIEKQKPRALRQGDKVGILSPASPYNADMKDKIIRVFENMGLKVVFGQSSSSRYGYLAGSDAARIADFHDFFADSSIKAIVCSRGGYGSSRLYPYLDFDLVARNPKIVMGYSDITFLLNLIFVKTGLCTFHGPMGVSVSNPSFEEQFSKFFFSKSRNIEICASNNNYFSWNAKRVHGTLMGGNLSIFSTLMGVCPELANIPKLLFLEDVGEEPYKLDRLFTHLNNCGIFESTQGVILGHFTHCDLTAEQFSSKPTFSLGQMFQLALGAHAFPVAGTFNFGHDLPNEIMPIGVDALFCPDEQKLILSELVVS